MHQTLQKSKKVTIFVDGEFIPSYSGAANRFHYLSRALQEHTDTEIIIILCDRGWSDIKQIKRESFKTYLVHPKLFKNINFLTLILKKEGVDIIQFANLELAIEVGMQLSNNLNKHLIFEAHYEDYEFAKSVGASENTLDNILFLQNTFGKYFDKVIALSAEDAKLSRNMRINQEDITVIPSGVYLDDFSKSCFDDLSKKIVFFGNIYFDINLKAVEAIKNTMYRKLADAGFKFYIIGDISRAEKEKLRDNKFLIIGKQEKLIKYFNKSTIALAPIFKGSGIRVKILNYLNAGIPVVTTSEGARGLRRKDLLIIENDLGKYPTLIEKLVKERKTLINLSKLGRRFVRENMSWEIVSKLVSKEYDYLLKTPVIPKEIAVHKILKLKFGDPVWIKEIIKNKIFKRIYPYIGVDRYTVISKK